MKTVVIVLGLACTTGLARAQVIHVGCDTGGPDTTVAVPPGYQFYTHAYSDGGNYGDLFCDKFVADFTGVGGVKLEILGTPNELINYNDCTQSTFSIAAWGWWPDHWELTPKPPRIRIFVPGQWHYLGGADQTGQWVWEHYNYGTCSIGQGVLPYLLTQTPPDSPYTTVRVAASLTTGTRKGPVDVSVVP